MKDHFTNQNRSTSDNGLDRLLERCGAFLAYHMGNHKRGQDGVLAIIARQPGITQKELAQNLDIQPASVSELLMKLEHKGLIHREKDELDRRSIRVNLTDAGIRTLDQRKEVPEDPFRSLSAGEQEQLRSLLEKLLADWEKRYPGERKHRSRKNHNHHRKEEHNGKHE